MDILIRYARKFLPVPYSGCIQKVPFCLKQPKSRLAFQLAGKITLMSIFHLSVISIFPKVTDEIKLQERKNVYANYRIPKVNTINVQLKESSVLNNNTAAINTEVKHMLPESAGPAHNYNGWYHKNSLK